jgi:hypothetical protein
MRSWLGNDIVRTVLGALLGIAIVVISVAVGVYLGATGAVKLPSRTSAVSAAAPADHTLDVYRGLGSWVDLYDARAWKDPAAAVADMASHGVRTIYVQTANSSSKSGLVHPAELATFIVEAHKRHMYVVAWYLPSFRPGTTDFDRVVQAVDFTTGDGQSFDSFAMDIESTTVKSEADRNVGLATLSEKVRARVGKDYALGAIIPSPLNISRKKGFWDTFPYATVAKSYDVLLPMNYYSFNIHDAAPTYDAMVVNMRILRDQKGCATIPVHMIGGISEDSTAAQVEQFVQATKDTGCIGASMYGWAGTTAAEWKALAAVKVVTGP